MRRLAALRTPMKTSTIVLLGILAFGAAACGSTASPTSPSPAPAPAPTAPAPLPTPTPSPSVPFTQTMTGTVGRLENVFHDLTVPRSGTLSVKLRWTDVHDDLDLGLTPGGCRIDESGCEIIADSVQGSGNIEQVS